MADLLMFLSLTFKGKGPYPCHDALSLLEIFSLLLNAQLNVALLSSLILWKLLGRLRSVEREPVCLTSQEALGRTSCVSVH